MSAVEPEVWTYLLNRTLQRVASQRAAPMGPYVSHFVGEDGKIFCTAVGTPASNEILVSSEGDLQTPIALPGGGKLE